MSTRKEGSVIVFGTAKKEEKETTGTTKKK
jgi:hypothetical protein